MCTLQLSPSLVIETDASKLGWGGLLRGTDHRRVLVKRGECPPYQCLGAHCSNIWSTIFLQEYIGCLCAGKVRQHNSCVAHQLNGGNEITTPGMPSERTVAVVPPKENTAQSRASPREGKSHGRFSLKAPKRQVGLDT